MASPDPRPTSRAKSLPAWPAVALAPVLLVLFSPAREGRADDPPRKPSVSPSVNPLPEVVRTRRLVELLEAEIAAKRAELKVQEIRLEQARQDLVAQERLHESELIRARERLQWAQQMFEKGFISEARVRADRERLELLEAGSRPDPAEETPAKPEGPGPGDEARRASDGTDAPHQAELVRARDRLRWSEQMFAKKSISKAQLEADRLTLKHAEANAHPAAPEEEPAGPEGPRP